MSPYVYDGFWLPAPLRSELLGSDTRYATLWFRDGQLTDMTGAAVGVRWPLLSSVQWETLLDSLGGAPRDTTSAEAEVRYAAKTYHADRWRAAMSGAAATLAEDLPLTDLAEITGFSPAMLAFALRALQWVDPADLAIAVKLEFEQSVASNFVSLSPLRGMIRFFPARRIPFGRRFFLQREGLSCVVGFAAGNVIGGALLPIFLAQLTGSPAILMKNSRHEAIFTPLVLSAIARSDPELLANVAVMIWDYTDADLQRRLLRRTDLVLAAADDATIDAIGRFVPRGVRYHRHGHKVSFTAVAREYAEGRRFPLEQLTRLTALDSVFWDQYGCLSSRVHFVEGAGDEYARALIAAMREWAERLPRGRASLRRQHTRFDRYKALEVTGQVQVLSRYDDPFLVVVDRRPPERRTLAETINDAVERTVFVRPVRDLMDVPKRCLAQLSPTSLQSMSLAVDAERLLLFAGAVGARGVTALRSAGRGAFPGLAHSWDGWLPLDFAYRRPDGYFTTIDFDDLDRELKRALDWINA